MGGSSDALRRMAAVVFDMDGVVIDTSRLHDGVGEARAHPGTIDLIAELAAEGIPAAVVSSDSNAEQVLGRAGVRGLLPVMVDGVDCADPGLAGEPDPHIYLEACRRLGAHPDRSAIVAGAASGVEAGSRGGFGLVIGVARDGNGDRLLTAGADLVVSDLAELLVGVPIADLPSALEGGVADELGGRHPAVFLDYDGTLSPIVSHPSQAVLPEATGEVLARLARRFVVAVVSGRDRREVESLVALPDVVYAGSHGFDIAGPDGLRQALGREHQASLAHAADELEAAVADLEGVWVERKRYAVALHFRGAPPRAEDRLRQVVEEVASRHRDLRVSGGKKILELRPDLEWDKGRAVLWLLDSLGLDRGGVAPIYIGDDETDEDAFRALRARGGIGIVVGGEERRSLARYSLAGPEEVGEFLGRLADRPGP